MFDRKKFHYKAQVQNGQDGVITEEDVYCYWTPEKDFTLGAVAATGAAQAALRTRNPQGQCIRHAGLSAVLVSE